MMFNIYESHFYMSGNIVIVNNMLNYPILLKLML